MTKTELYRELNHVDATRDCRTKYANLVVDNPHLFKPLLDIVFMVDDKLSSRAAWIFEFVCTKDLNFIRPHLEEFTSSMSKVHLDSSVRPVAKVTEMIVTNYYEKKTSAIKDVLSHQQRERIVEACFDWLIQEEKVAVKVYSMSSLWLLGNEFDWIHDELRLILQRAYTNQTAAYKARAKHVLKKLGITVPKCRPKNN